MTAMERRLLEGTVKFWKDEAKEESKYSLSLEKENKELKDFISKMTKACLPVSNAAFNLSQGHEERDQVWANVSTLDKLCTEALQIIKGK